MIGIGCNITHNNDLSNTAITTSGSIGIGTEADLALARSIAMSLSKAIETDLSFSLAALQIRSLGLSSEADSSFGLLPALVQPILFAGQVGSGPSNAAVRYTAPVGCPHNSSYSSGSSRPDTPVLASGIISNLWARCPAALTGVQSWGFTLVKNGVDTGLTCTITNAGLVASDTTHTVSVTAGDTICLKSSPSGTPTAQSNIQIGFVFTSANQTGLLFTGFNAGSVGTGYCCFGSWRSSTTAETSGTGQFPCAGAIGNISINSLVAPGVGNGWTFTLRVNGIDIASVNLTGTNTTATITGPFNFNAGDKVTIRKDVQAGTPTASIMLIGTSWTPTNYGEIPLMSPPTGTTDGTIVHVGALQGIADNIEVTETNVQNLAPCNFMITAMRADLSVAPGSGKSRAFMLRKNAADTAGTVTVQDSALNGTYTGAVSVSAGDLVDWKETPSGTPATAAVGVSSILKVF